jgi:hypothetical protein
MKKRYIFKGDDELKYLGIKKDDGRDITTYQTRKNFVALVEVDTRCFENIEYNNEEEFKNYWTEL